MRGENYLQSVPNAGHIRLNCPERQCFKCRGWCHEAVSCPSKVLTPKKNGEKKEKDKPTVLAVDQKTFRGNS